jgi:hypothetical protein
MYLLNVYIFNVQITNLNPARIELRTFLNPARIEKDFFLIKLTYCTYLGYYKNRTIDKRRLRTQALPTNILRTLSLADVDNKFISKRDGIIQFWLWFCLQPATKHGHASPSCPENQIVISVGTGPVYPQNVFSISFSTVSA